MNFLQCSSKLAALCFLCSVVLQAQPAAVAPPPLIEQCRDYYNFFDYEKTIETANILLKSDAARKNQALREECWYYINESCEELADSFQKQVNIQTASNMRIRFAELRKRYNVVFELKPDGIYYMVQYKHDALASLSKVKPPSRYLEIISLKRLLRISRYNTDPLYRFEEDLRVLGLYKAYIADYPGSRYLPNLLLKTADLYFSLYEEALAIKDRIGWSQQRIESLYQESRDLYKTIKKEYPGSDAAGLIGEIKMENVKLRKEPDTKAPIIRALKAGLLVKILDRSKERYMLSNMYEYWFRVRIPDGSEGWIYGFYLDLGSGY